MSIRRLIPVAGGLALSLAAMPAASLHAQAKDDVKADTKWVHEVAADNLLEVNLGKMAERKATNPAVKQFGERMVTDHGKANQELLSMASSHGLPFKPGLGRRHEQKVDRLEKVQGKEFDRAYIRSMIENHTDDISYFENEGRHAKSAPVRDYAAKYLPTLQQHLSMAKQIAGQVGADTALANHATTAAPKGKPKSTTAK
jgi:putative membrane protein